MAEVAAPDEGHAGKKAFGNVYDHAYAAETKRLTGNKKLTVPGLPWEMLDYLRMDLRLAPNDYLATSRLVYETADAVQRAYRAGIEAAREEQRKAAERKQRQDAALARLKEQVGG